MRDFQVLDEEGEVFDGSFLDNVREDLLRTLAVEDYRYSGGSTSSVTMVKTWGDVAQVEVKVVLWSYKSTRVALHYTAGGIYQFDNVQCADQSELKGAITSFFKKGNQQYRQQLLNVLEELDRLSAG